MSHPLSRLDRRLAILGEQIASQQRETISVERFNRDDHQPDGTVRPPRLEINRIAEHATPAAQPPLGVKPRHIWLAERCRELLSAIARFPDGHAIKVEMENELEEHVQTLKHVATGMRDAAKPAKDTESAPDSRLQSPPPWVIAGSMQVIKDALTLDPGYAIGWHANLAMAIKDAAREVIARDPLTGGAGRVADIAADLILQRLFGLPSNPDRCKMIGGLPRDYGKRMDDVNAQMAAEQGLEPYSVLQQRRQQEMQERLNQDAVDAQRYLWAAAPRIGEQKSRG